MRRDAPGDLVRVEPVPGLAAGVNELFVQASPPPEEWDRRHAVRIRIVREGGLVAEKTLWSESGGIVADTFRFVLEPSGGQEAP